MSQLTKDQVQEVAEVINRYAKPMDSEQVQQEERKRQKLIAFLKGSESRASDYNK